MPSPFRSQKNERTSRTPGSVAAAEKLHIGLVFTSIVASPGTEVSVGATLLMTKPRATEKGVVCSLCVKLPAADQVCVPSSAKKLRMALGGIETLEERVHADRVEHNRACDGVELGLADGHVERDGRALVEVTRSAGE